MIKRLNEQYDDEMSCDDMYYYLKDNCGISEETLQIVSKIKGYTKETMQSILYVVTGNRSFEQHRNEHMDIEN